MRDPASTLTLLACPKAFDGHVGMIQRNAIGSWGRLVPRPRLVLFGSDRGVAEAARELGAEHEPVIDLNDAGRPLLSGILGLGQRLAPDGLACFLNSDIVLMQDFVDAVRALPAEGRFLMLGRRTDLAVGEPIDFVPGWQGRLRERAAHEGRVHPPWGIDYFVFRSGLYTDVPELQIGRGGLDQWLLWRAHSLRVPVIDASAVVTAVHQDHGFGPLFASRKEVLAGTESQRNRALAGAWATVFDTRDSTHVLTPTGVERARGNRVRRAMVATGDAVPALRPLLCAAVEVRRRHGRRRARLLGQPGPPQRRTSDDAASQA